MKKDRRARLIGNSRWIRRLGQESKQPQNLQGVIAMLQIKPHHFVERKGKREIGMRIGTDRMAESLENTKTDGKTDVAQVASLGTTHEQNHQTTPQIAGTDADLLTRMQV